MIHSNIIIQELDILAEFNAINDDQLYILRGHKLYFWKKCILSLTIDFVLANSVDSHQMPHLGLQLGGGVYSHYLFIRRLGAQHLPFTRKNIRNFKHPQKYLKI